MNDLVHELEAAVDQCAELKRQRDDLIIEKEELQRQLDERGCVLELHKIRAGELEEIIRLMKVIVSQLDCQLEAENAIRKDTEKLLDGYRDLAIEDVNCARIAIKIARTINHNRKP